MKKMIILSICLFLLSSCTIPEGQPQPIGGETEESQANLPNPASLFCEENGGILEIRTDAEGNQYGVCIFPDGSECDEWAYYRNECQPGDNQNQGAYLPNPASVYCEEHGGIVEIRSDADGNQYGFCVFPDGSECDEWAYYRGECAPSENTNQGWLTYHNDQMEFSFQYPTDAEIEVDSDIDTVFITGPVMDDNAWPSFMISFPLDREDYQVPEGADLQKWLVDHNLYIDQPAANRLIAGKTAVHTRFSASQQSYANDRYYFVHDEQLFVITIGHAGGKEDWEVYDRFLSSFQFDLNPDDQVTPTSIPTAHPINPDDYQGWWTYTHHTFGFTMMLPEDWVVNEITTFDPKMNGHTLILHPTDSSAQKIHLSFRYTDEETQLWPTGVGQGDFVSQGTLDIAGISAKRYYLVCTTGEITAIWFHQSEDKPNIMIKDIEFGIIFTGSPSHCEPGYTLGGKTQLVGEMIISSIRVP